MRRVSSMPWRSANVALFCSEAWLRILRRVLASSFFALVSVQTARPQTDSAFRFQFTDKLGQYAVGLKVVEQYDKSRSFQVARGLNQESPSLEGRPLQTLLWYPAEKTSAPTMALGEYETLIETETSFGRPVHQGKPQSFVDAFMHGTTDLHTWAIRNAPMKTGRSPW